MFFPVQFVREHKTQFCAEIINFSGNALLVAAGNALIGQVTESALRALGFGETAILITLGVRKLIHGISLSFAAGGAIMYIIYHSPKKEVQLVYEKENSSL